MLRITRSISIDERELEFHFVRASGPGGQNVNKLATACQLRFDVAHSPALPAAVKDRLRRLAGRRMTAEGVLILDARRYRTQERNRRDAMERFVRWLRRAAAAPKPRKATQPTSASRRRRRETKQRRAQTKQHRRPPATQEE